MGDVKPDISGEQISIKVRDQVVFKIKRSTTFKKILSAYATKQGVDVKVIKFVIDGERIKEEDTPGSLDMNEGDIIDAQLEQQGGREAAGGSARRRD